MVMQFSALKFSSKLPAGINILNSAANGKCTCQLPQRGSNTYGSERSRITPSSAGSVAERSKALV